MSDITAAEAASPVLALRRAIIARLAADAVLVGILGGPRVYDPVPRAAAGVYVTFGDLNCRDWSTATDQGHQQDATLVVWSKTGGAKPALAAAARIFALLHEADLALVGHHLVNLRVTATEARRDARADLDRVTLRLSAVTQVLPAA
jgi:hypothetical protein